MLRMYTKLIKMQNQWMLECMYIKFKLEKDVSGWWRLSVWDDREEVKNPHWRPMRYKDRNPQILVDRYFSKDG